MIAVSAEVYQRAVDEFGDKAARNFLFVEGSCDHRWFVDTMAGMNAAGKLAYAYMREECERCHEVRKCMNLLADGWPNPVTDHVI